MILQKLMVGAFVAFVFACVNNVVLLGGVM